MVISEELHVRQLTDAQPLLKMICAGEPEERGLAVVQLGDGVTVKF